MMVESILQDALQITFI